MSLQQRQRPSSSSSPLPFFSRKCAEDHSKWFECPLSITIFTVVLILFLYSCIVLGYLSRTLVTYSTTSSSEEEENEKDEEASVHDLMVTYILNVVLTIMSLLVLGYYLFQFFPPSILRAFMNRYAAIALSLLLLIITSITIHTLRSVRRIDPSVALSFSVVVLLFSIALLCYFAVRLGLSFARQNGKKRT